MFLAANTQAATWIDPLGGNFNDAANWSPAAIPGVGENLLYQAGEGSTYTVTFQDTQTYGTLTVANSNVFAAGGQTVTFDLGGQTITHGETIVRGGTTPNTSLTLKSGTLAIAGATTTFFSGTNVPGTSVVSTGATLNTPRLTIGHATNAGANASGSSVTVNNGGQLSVSERILIGTQSGTATTDNNLLRVTGAGSSIVVNSADTSPLRVAEGASNGNSLEVLNGGSFSLTTTKVAASLSVAVGAQANSQTGNKILVSGAGSTFNMTNVNDRLQIGMTNVANSDNALIVENSGTLVIAGRASISGDTASNNRLVVDGGSATFGEVDAFANARVKFLAGSFNVTNKMWLRTDSRVEFDLGNGPLTITVGGQLEILSPILLDFVDIQAPGQYTLFNVGNVNGSFANFQIGNIAPQWASSTLSFDANNLFLNAVPEPSTVVLLVLGTGAFLLARSRRRIDATK